MTRANHYERASLARPGQYDGQVIDERAVIEREARLVRDARGFARYVTVRARGVIEWRDLSVDLPTSPPRRAAGSWRRSVQDARRDVDRLDGHAGAIQWREMTDAERTEAVLS